MNLNQLKVGDVVLYQRRKTIKEWDVNTISPSGRYIEIENDDWSDRWVLYTSILEIISTESGRIPEPIDMDEVIVAAEQPIVKATTADFAKNEV